MWVAGFQVIFVRRRPVLTPEAIVFRIRGCSERFEGRMLMIVFRDSPKRRCRFLQRFPIAESPYHSIWHICNRILHICARMLRKSRPGASRPGKPPFGRPRQPLMKASTASETSRLTSSQDRGISILGIGSSSASSK